MQLSTQKIAIIIIIVLGAFFGILIFKNSQEPIHSAPSEPIMTPVYLGSLSSAKMIVGSDLRVPAYLPPGYNFNQGSLFTNNQEKTELTFLKGSDGIHVFQGRTIESPPYFIENGESEQVSVSGNTGTWIPGTFRNQVPEKPFNQIQWSDGIYSYWIQSSLNKEDMIKIAHSLTPINDKLIQQIPGPDKRGDQNREDDQTR
jgi:hypothetical protein